MCVVIGVRLAYVHGHRGWLAYVHGHRGWLAYVHGHNNGICS